MDSTKGQSLVSGSHCAAAPCIGGEGATVGVEEEQLPEWVEHRHFEEIDSTQSYVEREYESFSKGVLTAVSTDFQTAGRGTGSRSWSSGTSGLNVFMTFFFRFPTDCETSFVNQNVPNVTQVLAVAAVDALKQVTQDHTNLEGRPLEFCVKWPNDIILNGGKVGGILARAIATGGRLDAVIVGIGININMPMAGLEQIDRPVWPATSLHSATGESQTYDVSSVRRRLINTFAEALVVFFAGGFGAFRGRVNSLQVFRDTRVRFRVPNSVEVEGMFEGLNESGHIVLQVDGGELRVFPSGEIIPLSQL